MTYFSAFPCLLGLTILLLQTIFVSKKAVNNEKWKAQNNSFDSFDCGQKNKRLTEREARLTLKMGVLGVSGVSGAPGVSGVSGVPHQRVFPNQVCSTAKC